MFDDSGIVKIVVRFILLKDYSIDVLIVVFFFVFVFFFLRVAHYGSDEVPHRDERLV